MVRRQSLESRPAAALGTTLLTRPPAPGTHPRRSQTVPTQSPVLLITGASRGIGAATARLAATRGWDVAINYARDAGAAETVAAAVRQAGQRAITVAADVADEAAVLAMFQRVDAELGPLAGLVNNAGIVAMKARLDEMDFARWQHMWAVNLSGSFLCARVITEQSVLPGAGVDVVKQALTGLSDSNAVP